MHYSAVIVSNSLPRLRFSALAIAAHSLFMKELILVLDFKGELPTELHTLVSEIESRYQIPVVIEHDKNLSKDVYGNYNRGVARARNEHVLLLNDDMYTPPGWDTHFSRIRELPIKTAQMVLTFALVESGYTGVNDRSVHKDFGQTIETFQRDSFDQFAKSHRTAFFNGNTLGWYMPVIFPKSLFESFGGYPTEPPFPFPNDILFFDRLLKEPERAIFVKHSSPIYHFQKLSQRPVDNAKKSRKLNLCSGHDYIPEYLNVDKTTGDLNVDLSKGALPFENASFEEVLFKHALEHFPFHVGKKIIAEIARILTPGGTLRIHVPDLALACSDFLQKQNQYPHCASAIERIYGQNSSDELIHKSGYTEESLATLLTKAGFSCEKAPKLHADEIVLTATKNARA